MRRCGDVKMRRCEDVRMSRWEDVRMWRMRRCEDVKMSRCEADEKMWRWEDVKMLGCEGEKIWGCEDEKMWRGENVWQTPAIRRTLRSDALGKKSTPKITLELDPDFAQTRWCLDQGSVDHFYVSIKCRISDQLTKPVHDNSMPYMSYKWL